MVQDELGGGSGTVECTAACGWIAVLAWLELLLQCAVHPRSFAVFTGSQGTHLHAGWILRLFACSWHLPNLPHRFAFPLKFAHPYKHGSLHFSLPVL